MVSLQQGEVFDAVFEPVSADISVIRKRVWGEDAETLHALFNAKIKIQVSEKHRRLEYLCKLQKGPVGAAIYEALKQVFGESYELQYMELHGYSEGFRGRKGVPNIDVSLSAKVPIDAIDKLDAWAQTLRAMRPIPRPVIQ